MATSMNTSAALPNGSSCAAEAAALRATVESLQARVAHLEAQLGEGALMEGPSGRRLEEACHPQKRDSSNLIELLPSSSDADMTRFDGRCSRRHLQFESAWDACMKLTACVGVVRDNGLLCGGGRVKHQFELRGGGLHRGPGSAWVCPSRLKQSISSSASLVAPTAPAGTARAQEGFIFIVLGACARPDFSCVFLREVRDAIAALRAVHLRKGARPIAVISDGGISTSALMATLKPDLVHMIPSEMLQRSSVTQVSDIRVRKLLAYRNPPFERNVFFDGDTHVRGANVEMLFEALGYFDLAASFECCRIDYTSASIPYDQSGFMRGWEMQTGVMAYRRSPRLDAFWAETTKEYEARIGYWSRKSSGEQGAATLALSRVDVRFMPLPPSFNARPYTMLSYINTFGLVVYHGKELWKGVSIAGSPAPVESMIAERMLRDWDSSRDVIARQFAAPFLANISQGDGRGWRRINAARKAALQGRGGARSSPWRAQHSMHGRLKMNRDVSFRDVLRRSRRAATGKE